jgi:hypothetical protein
MGHVENMGENSTLSCRKVAKRTFKLIYIQQIKYIQD